MSNIVKAKLRLKKKVKSTLTSRWDADEPIVTTDTGELYIGMGETIDAIKISDVIIVDTLPLFGVENKIYIKKSNKQSYYWNGTKFIVISGQGGVESFTTFSTLPSTGIKDIIYVVKTDEKFYPTTETSLYVWDDFNSKYLLVSRAKPTNSFGSVDVDDISILATDTKDTFKLKAGTGISIDADPDTKTITINQTAPLTATVSKKSYAFDGGVKSATMPTGLGLINSAIIGDKIYITGGWNGSSASNLLQCYNVTTGTCTSIGTIPSARCNPTTISYNGNLYMAGGWGGSASLKDFWMYNPLSNSWNAKPNLNTTRSYAFEALIGDKLWIIGGLIASSTSTPTIEYYDFNLESWVQLDAANNMPTSRYGGSTFVFGNKIYCCGGYTGTVYTQKVEVFDTETFTWTTLTNMPVGRYGAGSTTYNGLGYAFAGSQSAAYTKTLYVYNPEVDKWHAKENMTTARIFPAVERYDNTFYVIGGMISSAGTTNTIEAYSVASEQNNGCSTVSMLYPVGNTILNTNSGESSRYLALDAGEIWYYGAWDSDDFKAIITEMQI